MRGTYDPANDYSYTIVGGDLGFRLNRTNLRFEYLVRRQEFDTSDPRSLKYDVVANGDFVVKHGAYAELETPLSEQVDLIARADGHAPRRQRAGHAAAARRRPWTAS